MVFLLVLLFIVLAIFLYLFFAPLYLEIDTSQNLFRVRFNWLASARLKIADNILIIEIKFAGFTKQLNPFARENPSEKKVMTKKLNREPRKKNISWKKLRGILASFKVNKCKISLDMGDMQLNGILYPLFYLVGFYSRKNIRINFIDENEIILKIKSNFARMSWAYISS